MSRLKRAGSMVPVALALVLGAVFSGLITGNGSLPVTSIAEAEGQTNQRTISVSGEGHVYVTSDTAQVTLGVLIQNADLGAAQQEANQKMNAVLAALKANGVADDQIKTVTYNISVQRDYQKPDQPITGYRVTHMVQAKVKPMDKVSAVIDAAVAAGANAVNDVVFTVENQDAPLQQAREQAVNNARAKAEQLAKLTGGWARRASHRFGNLIYATSAGTDEHACGCRRGSWRGVDRRSAGTERSDRERHNQLRHSVTATTTSRREPGHQGPAYFL